MKTIKIFIIYSVIALLISCAHYKSSTNKLLVNTHCDNYEIESDIEYSVEQLSSFLRENNILVNRGKSGCGYTLKGNQIKDIEGALTDYDLMIEIKSFFGL